MSLSGRSLRRSVVSLLCILSGVCTAQTRLFLNVPVVESTPGRVASFVPEILQQPPNRTDILWVDAPTVSGVTSSITVGELLSGTGGQGFFNLGENQITFPNVSNVVAALGDFNADGTTDYAFALTPTTAGAPNLCIYYGTGLGIVPPGSYNGGPAYPPTGNSGCMIVPTRGSSPPSFGYIAALPFKTGLPPQLILEDTKNNYLYALNVGGAAAGGGVLVGVNVTSALALPAADGTGPLYVGDFNNDGNMDFIVNGQAGNSASVYFGDGTGSFQPPVRYTFDHNVHSMLLYDMDLDGHQDMVVEGDQGVIEIFHGNPDGTFATTSIGGTPAGIDGFSGHGGHLAAINPNTLDILTATPIGLSLLRNQGGLSYALHSIYNIGPGRTSFALAAFLGTNNLDLAVDSAEGVAFVAGNPDGTFRPREPSPRCPPRSARSSASSETSPTIRTGTSMWRSPPGQCRVSYSPAGETAHSTRRKPPTPLRASSRIPHLPTSGRTFWQGISSEQEIWTSSTR